MNRLLSTSVMAALVAVSPTVVAQDNGTVTAIEAQHKVDVTGRQRMLSQRMAKAACLMARDVNFAATYDQLTQAYSLFERSNAALRAGDAELELPVESQPDVLNALAAVDGPWASYKTIVQTGIDGGTIEESELEALDEASLDVLKYMNIATFKTARTYAELLPGVPLGLTITIDVAGRQRMLTQKAVKEACLMAMAEDPSIHADELAETIEIFDLSLKSLRDGYEDVGVIAAPTREIDRKLLEVEGLWEPVKAILDRAADGVVLTDREVGRLERLSEPLLRTMNEAVALYKGVEQFL